MPPKFVEKSFEIATKPRNLWKFSPSNLSHYTVQWSEQVYCCINWIYTSQTVYQKRESCTHTNEPSIVARFRCGCFLHTVTIWIWDIAWLAGFTHIPLRTVCTEHNSTHKYWRKQVTYSSKHSCMAKLNCKKFVWFHRLNDKNKYSDVKLLLQCMQCYTVDAKL